MADLKPLKISDKKAKASKRFPSWSKWVIMGVIAVIFLLAALVWTMSQSSTVFNYVLGKGTSLKLSNNRVNVLLLGIAGGTHDGPNLTDTIMVASYDMSSRQVVLISLPRDLWVDSYRAKINTLYFIGLEKGDSLGIPKKEIGDILGLEIPYAIRVDFNGFIKAVNLLDGVDVDVVRQFDDYAYPVEGKEDDLCGYQEREMEIDEDQSKSLGVEPGKHKVLLDKEGKVATSSAKIGNNIEYTDEQVFNYFSCRFEHLQFKAGLIHMDGVSALKFVRSRHALGPEGTDFARSKRQQQVLQAFKDKALSFETMADLKKLVELAKTFGSSVETDIPQGQYLDFIKLIKQAESSRSIVIDGGGDDPLFVTPKLGDFGGAWVLVPAGNDYTRIHQYVADSFLPGVSSQSAKEKR